MTNLIIDINQSGIINRNELKAVFSSLKSGKHLLTVQHISKRTLSQNAYYWSVVVPLCKIGLNGIGYNEVKTDNDAHDILKRLFLKGVQYLNKAVSTALLTAAEFIRYVADVQQWAAEYLSVYIPDPNEPTALLADYGPWKQQMVDE